MYLKIAEDQAKSIWTNGSLQAKKYILTQLDQTKRKISVPGIESIIDDKGIH